MREISLLSSTLVYVLDDVEKRGRSPLLSVEEQGTYILKTLYLDVFTAD